MPGISKATLSTLTSDAILAGAFDRLRPRLLAMIGRRIGSKLALRIDPEGVIHDAFVRARPRWPALIPRPDDLDAWIYGQVRDRLIELIRGALGPEHNVDRDIAWPDGAAAPLAEHLVDSQTGPSEALSRAERCEVVRAALEKLDPIEREILALRYFDGLDFNQIGAILGLKTNTANARCPPGSQEIPKPDPDRLPSSRGKPVMTTALSDSESSVPELLQRFEQELLEAPDPQILLERYQSLHPELAEPFRELAEAIQMLQGNPFRSVPETTSSCGDCTSPRQFGPYRVVRSIGRGGMGEVYEAVEEPLARRIAVKTIRRSQFDRSHVPAPFRP